MAKVFVYVDGFNLYYGALKGTPHKWLNLRALCQVMLPTDEIAEIKYFSANVSATPSDPGIPMRQAIYLRALRTLPGVSIVLGQFRTRPTRMRLTGGGGMVWVEKTEEKGSDVNLASHLLLDGFERRYEAAVIISNDSDLRTPVRMVRDHLTCKVGILNPHEKNPSQLISSATFVKRIRQHDLGSSQFSPTLTDSKGTITKPSGW